MRNLKISLVWMGIALGHMMTGCGGQNSPGTPVLTTYMLTVNSVSPDAGVAIVATPADITGTGNGSTSFSRTYDARTSVTLTAPATSGGSTFASWTGCTSSST